MSAEAFQTCLSADVRTAPDGRGVEYAEAHTQQPRWIENGQFNHAARDQNPWASCIMYAEDAIKLSARAIREQPMDGLTGDHPEKREELAAALEHLAARVRLLALDHACDGALTDERWEEGKKLAV